MAAYVIRRVLYSIPVLIVSTFLSFTFISLAGDPRANLRANPNFSVQTYNMLEHKYHLDRAIPVRYWYWVEDAFTHKLGSSLRTSQPIWPDITRTFSHTGQVILFSEAIALLLGVAIGIYSAIRQYSVFDYFFTSFSFLSFAMPTFWLALLLQITLRRPLPEVARAALLHLGAEQPRPRGVVDRPDATHRAAGDHALADQLRRLHALHAASMLDVINSDYVRTARAKGVPEIKVISRHIVRNALIPILTVATHHHRRPARRGDRHRDRLLARRDGLLLRAEARCARPLPGHGLPRGHVGDHHRGQPRWPTCCTDISTRASA